MEYRYLAESSKYKVFSLADYVYLKNKANCKSHTEYEQSDENIAWIYGEPDSAIITFDERYVVIAGCGISVYDIQLKETTYLFSEPDSIEWTEGVYLGENDEIFQVRFNALTKTEKLVIKRLNLKSHNVDILS
ncbi:hypothetical protein [Zooshikella ganghwensis]|uniref:hypothetical protein n=1 Tax=Zooshikella ganghwensis TaxID=202772 RepID=UPI000485A4BA|nr:hypothetical protein [Zooshikella ganghwensis]